MVVKRILPLPRPAGLAPPTEVPLDGQDLAMPKMVMHCIWFFLASSQPSLESTSLQELEQAFTLGMQLFLARFPAAGARTRHDKDTARWYLEYNDQGADLEVIQLDRPLQDDWKALDGKCDSVFAPRPVMIFDDDASIFSIKVTRLSCGSVAISTSTHHWLVDFVGYIDLMEELSHCVSIFLNDPNAQINIDEGATKFDWSRDLLAYSKQLEPESIPSATWFTERGSPPQMTRAPSSCHYASLLFTQESLEKLKRSLAEWALETAPTTATERIVPSKDNWIATNDALHALLWAAITDARGLDPNATTQLHTPLDGRRLLSSLSSADSQSRGKYIGNVHPGHVFPLPSSVVSAKDRSGLFNLAWLIRTQYLNVTPGQMSAIIRHHNYTDAETFGPGRLPKCTSMFGNDVTISNVARIPVRQRLDFGEKLGKPYTLTVVGMVPVTLNGLTLDSADGTCFIIQAPAEWTSKEAVLQHQPRSGDNQAPGGMLVYVGMRSEEMDKLLQNSLLQEFALVL